MIDCIEPDISAESCDIIVDVNKQWLVLGFQILRGHAVA
jgi:hypothetical protein